MSAARIRVWVEEINPPHVLRFSWKTPADHPLSGESAGDVVKAALVDADGVLDVQDDGSGLLVEIEPEQISRIDLAATIRSALQPDAQYDEPDEARIRVWAEDFSASEMRITWEASDGEVSDENRHQRRRVAAWVLVLPGVRSAALDDEGVVVRYDPETLERGRLGDDVRRALDDDVPLRERADELLKRAKTYGNLARKLALDDRISPLPDAAKQAVATRAAGGGRNVAVRTAVRFVPGAALISRIQTLLPVLMELSKWSREADPAVVDGHLASVGLDRDTLRRDTITAHEIRYYARDSAVEHAAALGEKASAGAKQALSVGREMLESMRRAMENPEAEEAAKRDQRATSPEPELDAPNFRRDSSQEDPE